MPLGYFERFSSLIIGLKFLKHWMIIGSRRPRGLEEATLVKTVSLAA